MASLGKAHLLGVLLLAGASQATLSQQSIEGWQNSIVPGSTIGEFRHGTFPSWRNNTHVGYDLVAPCGSPIKAWKGGRVADIVEKKNDPNFNSLGFMVLLEHSTQGANPPEYSIYLHLKEAPKGADRKPIKVNSMIPQGAIIGTVGDTGAAQGCHLHFEARRFAGRFNPVWGNIYGPGDKRADAVFRRDWIDPGKVAGTLSVANSPTFDSVFVDPRGLLKGVTRLPPRSIILKDELNCDKVMVKTVSALVPRGLKCGGQVSYDGTTYLYYPNWMRSVKEPGTGRIVVAGAKPQVLTDIAGAKGGSIVALLVDGRYLDFISIAPSPRYSEKVGNPYLRYRITGPAGSRRIELLPSTMFAKGQSPIDTNRKDFLAFSQPTESTPGAPRSTGITNTERSVGPSTTANTYLRGGAGCGSINADGVILNLGDFFQCDEGQAIRAMQAGRRIVFKPGTVSFTEGKFVASMRQESEEVIQAKRRMDEHGDRVRSNRPLTQQYEKGSNFWGDWNRVTQQRPFTIVCRFNTRQVERDRPIVVFAKLVTYSSRTAILDCS